MSVWILFVCFVFGGSGSDLVILEVCSNLNDFLILQIDHNLLLSVLFLRSSDSLKLLLKVSYGGLKKQNDLIR